MDEKLKPCPFCGGDAYFDKDDESGWQWIECGRCHVATSQRASLMEDCKPLLAEAWNSRTTIDPDAIRAEARAEALKEAADDYAHGSWGNYIAIHFLEWLIGKRHITKPEDINLPTNELPRLLEQAERYEKELAEKHAAILADEPKEERGAEVGDIVTWTNSHGARMIGIFGREITQGDAIILMRRAEVEAVISRGGI